MRIDWQAWEEQFLSPQAIKSSESRGRKREEAECEIRTVFQRDRDRIIHSKSFRRLKHKTQVFIATRGDHFRTRLTHTLEVSQISRTIARALFLNEDLTEAIALGHDLGHTPFGHAGERALQKLYPTFSHNRQSLRVVDLLERDGQGLNLTYEVRDGILHHSGADGYPFTLEGAVVRLSDRIAYINHDIDDALRAGLLTVDELPRPALAVVGDSHSKRINTMVRDVIDHSLGQTEIRMSETVAAAMNDLRDFLFARVYMRSDAQREEVKITHMIADFYQYYLLNPQELPPESQNEDAPRATADYIAGMTDLFALQEHKRLFSLY